MKTLVSVKYFGTGKLAELVKLAKIERTQLA